ncbi:MAG: phosphoserine phosphatase SerB [Rhodoblastus sp.]
MSQTLSHVATLVCNPQAPILTNALAERARAALANAGAVTWLDNEIAADIAFAPETGFEPMEIETTLRAALDHAPVDFIVQPLADRRKKLFVADMDSTIIGQECIDELADLVGVKAHVAAITERAMRGEIAFEPALRERVALLKGLDASVPEKVIAERITITPGARALVRTMRANGAYTALVSGGFTAFTSRIAATVGFDENRANRLVIDAGKFAGLVEEPILGAEAKLSSIIELRDARGLSKAQTIAAGDGANDLPMLREAGLGVAFRAKPAVAAAADARIQHSDLSALLYAQGYARADFVA